MNARHARFRWRFTGIALAVTGFGCGAVEYGEQSLTTEEAITHGRETRRFPYVGLLTSDPSSGPCTGTLVGRRFVLTSAFCAASSELFEIGGRSYEVSGFHAHARFDAAQMATDEGVRHNLAIVELVTPASTPPARVAATAPVTGDAIRLVGFGSSASGVYDGRVKRTATNEIVSRTSDVLYFDTGKGGRRAGACHGGDGGAAVLSRNDEGRWVLAGVLVPPTYSFSTDACAAGASNRAVRVDSHQRWLRKTIVRAKQLRQPNAEIAFDTLEEGGLSAVNYPLAMVIRKAKRWRQFYKELNRNYSPVPPLPAVDFTKRMVIAVGLGARSSTGYRVTIEAVTVLPDGDLVVRYVEQKPGMGCGSGALVTQPYHLVTTRRRPGRYHFVSQTRNVDCR